MDISVIIATRNRSDRLPVLFDSLSSLTVRPGIEWEVLLVNNASSDRTPQVIEQEAARKRLPLVYLHEPVAGKSRALNLALRSGKGSLIVFTDDDVILDPGWLMAFYDASLDCRDTAGFSGRVLPLWEDGAVPWWAKGEEGHGFPYSLINKRDFGSKFFDMPAFSTPGGLNAALRKSALAKMGYFREDLGPGTRFPYAEDTEYFRRAYGIGGGYYYIPDALIFHINISERMTLRYVLNWSYHCARSEVQINDYDGIVSVLGMPRYLIRQIFEYLAKSFFAGPRLTRLTHLRQLLKCIGECVGHIQKNIRGNSRK